jgi:hypothetical protein
MCLTMASLDRSQNNVSFFGGWNPSKGRRHQGETLAAQHSLLVSVLRLNIMLVSDVKSLPLASHAKGAPNGIRLNTIELEKANSSLVHDQPGR